MHRITRHLSPAMIVALVALASSLTGGAIAAKLITGKQVRNSSLTGADVKDRSLTGKDVRKASLGADRLTSAARAVLKGQQGSPGAKGDPGAKGEQGAPGAAGPAAITTSANAGRLEWAVLDEGTNANSTTLNGGLSVVATGGATSRTITAAGMLPSTAMPGTSGRFTALHVCYRATATIRLVGVGVIRLRGDQTDTNGVMSQTSLLDDTTTRSDKACRRLPITGDQVITPADSFWLFASIETTTNAGGSANTFRLLSVALEATTA